MSRIFKIEEDDFKNVQQAGCLKIGDRYDECYGAEFVEITKEQLRELENGKILYFNVMSEYVALVRLKNGEEF